MEAKFFSKSQNNTIFVRNSTRSLRIRRVFRKIRKTEGSTLRGYFCHFDVRIFLSRGPIGGHWGVDVGLLPPPPQPPWTPKQRLNACIKLLNTLEVSLYRIQAYGPLQVTTSDKNGHLVIYVPCPWVPTLVVWSGQEWSTGCLMIA